MSTSIDPTPTPETSSSRCSSHGSALRLHLNAHLGRDALDGGWWPRSRDLATELADLVDNLPPDLGRTSHVLVSPGDWDERLRSVPVADGQVEVGSLPPADTHLIDLTTSGRARLRLLVVPSDFTDDQGQEALLAAATARNSHPATELLDTVTEYPDVDPRDHWPAEG